ncbi:MAG: Xenobiotic-transporting ATPase Phosphate-transporting ATPase [Ilumatobacteraceae bacterium]|nr:Xenobiotic-transporting ATPase Phosphate-transporting ATPase [Ilumatobacteraceae bacterium]
MSGAKQAKPLRPEPAYTRPAPAGPGIGWLRRLGPFIGRYKKAAIWTLIFSVVAQTLIGLLPLIQEVILDHGIIKRERPVGPLIIVLVLTGVFGFSANYGRRYLGAKVSVDLQHDLRLAIHRHLYELDFSRHDELSVGDIMSRATADLTLIQLFFFSVPMLVANLTLLVVAIVVMFVLSPLLSLVVVVFIPVFAFVAVRFRDKVFPASWNDQRLSGMVAGVVDEAVTGVRVVKAFAQEDREFNRLVDRTRELYQSRMRTARFNARYSSTLQTLPMLGQLGVLAFGGWLAYDGHITLGVFLAFASYLVQIITPVRLVSSMMATTQQARAGAERVFELLDLEPRVSDAPDARTVEHPRGEITLDHVTFGYGEGAASVNDVSLHIRPGERIGLVGASGSGKTTLAFLIARFYDPTSGTVRLDGVDERELTLQSLRSAVNVVFEESFLFSLSIRDNIAFGRPDASDAEIEAAARMAQAHEFILALSEGYETMVGERGFTLSGGQRQRIALARAALANPAVMIFDDATSAIDARTEEAIHESLEAALGQRTSILIAHRSSTLRLADRVLVIDEGRIVAEGTNAELWQTSPLYRELLTGPEIEPIEVSLDDIVTVDAAAWPRSVGDDRGAPQIELSTMLAGMSTNTIGSRAGLVAATPELLAQVEALPPLRGDPEVDLDDAIAPDGRSSLQRLVKRFRWALVLVGLLVVVDAGTTLIGPLLIRHGLDTGVEMHRARTLVAMCIAFLAVQLLSWGNQIVELLHTSRTSERMLYSLRARTFAHLQRLSLDYYDKEMGGRIMTRMTTDVEALAQLLQQGLLLALTSLVSCAGVIVILFVLDVRLALAALVVLPPLLIVTVWFQRASRRCYLRAREAIQTVNAELQESVAGVRVTQSLGRDDNNAVRFTARSVQYRQARLRSMQLMSIYFASSQLLSTIAKALTLWFGSRLIGEGSLSSGLLIAFLLYLDQFFSPLQQLSAVFDQWIQARVSLGRLDELLATPSLTPEPANPVRLDHVVGHVQLQQVRFAYSAKAPEALRGVDLDIAPGERVALVGTTGAGKSTFVKLVARFYDPTAGRVLVDSVDLRDLDLHSFRAHIGYVPQEPFLFSGTIRSNIAYGKPNATDLEIELAARAVGAHDLVASMPDGYFTTVAETGRSLSAGQRQLLCLARAQLIDPSILILDEATSNLDLATEAKVQLAMNMASIGRTTLLIAHRLNTARNASRIVVVDDGLIVEDGSHDDLVALGGRYAALWDAFDHATAAAPS